MHSSRPPTRTRRFLNLFTLVGVVTTFVLVGTSGVERAQSATPLQNIVNCPVGKRFENWDAIIKHGLSSGDFISSWGDVLFRSACHLEDIFSLQNQLEAAQNQLRQKVFSCQTTGVAALTQQVNDIKFELEYVRNVMDTNEEQPSPDGSKALVRSPAKLRQLLQQSVVVQRELVSSDRFEKLFNQFQAKYTPRLEGYANCKDENWETLRRTWNDFTDTWAGLSPAWKKLKKTTETKAKALTGPSGRSGPFLSGFMDVRLNNLLPQQTLTGIYQQLQSGGSKSGQAPDFLNILSGAEQDYGRYIKEEDQTKRRAYYEVLYKEFGDSAAKDMLDEIKTMNKTIQDTLAVTDQVRICTKAIGDRQCGGK